VERDIASVTGPTWKTTRALTSSASQVTPQDVSTRMLVEETFVASPGRSLGKRHEGPSDVRRWREKTLQTAPMDCASKLVELYGML
jgi:hypothetical protein